MIPSGHIEWQTLGQTKFDRIVESLLIRKYELMVGYKAVAIDGRGGDGGRDIEIFLKGESVGIYQLKYFPEGISGDYKTSRRRQITKSFKAATEWDPKFWLLVVPRNLTPGEMDFIKGLKGKNEVSIEVMGRAELDNEMSKHPNLLNSWLREPIMDELRLMGQESAALAHPHDVVNRFRALRNLSQGRSAYYEFDYELRGNEVIETIRVIDAEGAAKHEPIGVSWSVAQLDSNPELRRALERMVNFGSGGRVVIPRELVSNFQITGPDWIAAEWSEVEVELGTLPLAEGEGGIIEIRFEDENGISRASYKGEIIDRGMGDLGLSIKTSYPGGLIIEFFIQTADDETASISLRHFYIGQKASDVARSFQLRQRLYNAEPAVIYIRGEERFRTNPLNQDRKIDSDDPQFADVLQLSEDLTVIGRAADIEFDFPQTLSVLDHIYIRTTRLMLEGNCVLIPQPYHHYAMVGRDATYPLPDSLTEGAPLRVTGPYPVEIQGHKMSFGELVMYHPRVRATNAHEVNAALKSGTGEGMRINGETVDDNPFRFALVNYVRLDAPMRPVSWSIQDVDEHPRLEHVWAEVDSEDPAENSVRNILN